MGQPDMSFILPLFLLYLVERICSLYDTNHYNRRHGYVPDLPFHCPFLYRKDERSISMTARMGRDKKE